jgi:ribonuclease HII
MFCGVDEAGRGSVMGPLVVGTVFVEDDSILRGMGVRDSKKLTPKARERIYAEIVDTVPFWRTVVCSAADIDRFRLEMSLNEIELRMFADATRDSGASQIYADCPDVNESAFQDRLGALCPGAEIIARHKADDTYPVVSAASIVAKVTRDRMIEDIRREFGTDIGSGYPSDHYTMDFIESWIKENGRAPDHTRCSWEPVRQMLSKRANTKITDW